MSLTEEARRAATEAEDEIDEAMWLAGWEVYRNGWPDFLCVGGSVTIAVEVKSGEGKLTREQCKMMNALASANIDCYIWHPGRGLTLYQKGRKPKRPVTYPTRIVPMEKYPESFSNRVMEEHERVTGRVLTVPDVQKEKDSGPVPVPPP